MITSKGSNKLDKQAAAIVGDLDLENQLEELINAAYDEGFEVGKEEGLLEGRLKEA